VELISQFVGFVLHLDAHLLALTQSYGTWVYAILCAIIFCETGLVVAPFLPGDSLLFVAGSVAAGGAMDVHVLWLLLVIAAVLGDNTNYWIGRYIGPRVFRDSQSRFLNRAYLDKTRAFYERHGGKTIIFARFVPIIRTFAPFVAGIGRMDYRKFFPFSLLGGTFWIGFFVYLGYYFGGLQIVKENLTLAIMSIILLSVSPGIVGWWRARSANRGT
jgi:membrane-associated protein